MDMQKTGTLIAQARREKDLTQRALAEKLHVSDRAVSKWERGAGFPDVSILERLAQALDLKVLDLLRGEKTAEQDVEAALKEAMEAVRQQRRRNRRRLLVEWGCFALFLLAVAAFWLAWSPPATAVGHTVTAGVYENGVLVAYTPVELQGSVSLDVFTGRRSYWGRFAIGCVEWTTRAYTKAGFSLDGEDGITYQVAANSTRELYDFHTLCSYDMRNFAFSLSGDGGDWLVLATSPQMYLDYAAQFQDAPPLQSPPGDWSADFTLVW